MNDFEIVRDWIAEFPQPEAHEALDRIEAELARLREEHAKENHMRLEAEYQRDRLRERVHGYEEQVRGLLRAEYQRDTLLAALREIADEAANTLDARKGCHWAHRNHESIARTAISEVEGEPTDAEVLRGLGYYSEVEGEKK